MRRLGTGESGGLIDGTQIRGSGGRCARRLCDRSPQPANSERVDGAAAAGLVFHIFAPMGEGPTTALLRWLIGVAIFFVPFALGGLGGGDVKLLGALGAWLGPSGFSGRRCIRGYGRRDGNYHRACQRIVVPALSKTLSAAGALARCRDSRVAAV